AGIASERLQLALEPEVASIWCQTDSPSSTIALAGPGTQYMVVDLGGYEAQQIYQSMNDYNGSLKEIEKASGGPWGGINVDENYITFLGEIFGEEALSDLKDTNMEDYFKILNEFEGKKRNFTGELAANFVIKFSPSLRNKSQETFGKSLQNRIEELGYRGEITVKPTKMLVSTRIVSNWFEGPVTKLINHIRKILSYRTMRNVHTIVLVGGFSESKYVQTKALYYPHEAGLAVLKGAVKFGHFPFAVKSRVLRYTYGVCIDSSIHSEESKFFKLQVNDWRARDCFKVFAAVDDEVRYDTEFVYKFAQRGTISTSVRIFRSTERSPVYVTEPDCEFLGTIELNHTIDYVTIQITFMFGQTELMVKARLMESGRESTAVLNCIPKGRLKETGRGQRK
ncbi:HS12B-like protein, partial [Mya arenaria]